MKMEHRLSRRKLLTLDVSLYYAPLGCLQGRTRDVSLTGMFVETDTARLPLSSTLEVAFKIGDGPDARIQRVRALVARVTDEGVGLMFDHFKYTAYCALQEMLKVA
jgi:energy-converting hydrogenase Eha subunit H